MAVRIRLTRKGRKKQPFYRIVVADSQAPRGLELLANPGAFLKLGEADKPGAILREVGPEGSRRALAVRAKTSNRHSILLTCPVAGQCLPR